MKTMDQHTTGNEWGFIGGFLVSITGYLLNIDWAKFLEEIGPESIKVIVLGCLGGAAGLLGKKIVEKIFFKKKK